MRAFKAKVVFKIAGALGEAFTLAVTIQGEMKLIDTILIALIAAFFLSLGSGKGEEETVEIEIPEREVNRKIIVRTTHPTGVG